MNEGEGLRLLLIHTGGTIATERKENTLSVTEHGVNRLVEKYRELGGKAEFEIDSPYDILSETLDAEKLLKLGECLKKHISGDFDGIIITHGTDTLQYTSAFLSYYLGSISIPVVMVSANYPLDDNRSNGLQNLFGAVVFIREAKAAGVFAAYKNTSDSRVTIHRGTRLLAHEAYEDSLKSVFDSPFGYIEGESFAANPGFTDDEPYKAITPDFGKPVLYLRAYVGIEYPSPLGFKAVLLEGYHSGTLNTSDKGLIRLCKQASEENIPVFLTGDPKGFEYETKQNYASLGIVSLPPAAPIAAYVRLMMLPEASLRDQKNYGHL